MNKEIKRKELIKEIIKIIIIEVKKYKKSLDSRGCKNKKSLDSRGCKNKKSLDSRGCKNKNNTSFS